MILVQRAVTEVRRLSSAFMAIALLADAWMVAPLVIIASLVAPLRVPVMREAILGRISMTSYKINPEIVFRKEEDEALLFHPETTETCVINSTGVFILSLCSEKIPKKDILSRVKDKFEKPTQGSMEKDLNKFLEKLSEKKFLIKIE